VNFLTKTRDRLFQSPSARDWQRAENLIPIPAEARGQLSGDEPLVISYPRSGNTWLCVQLAHAWEETLKLRGIEPINGWQIADLHREPVHPLLSREKSDAHPRIFRSHNHLRSGNHPILYLVRSPEDALVSYYRLVVGESGKDPSGFAWERIPDWIAHAKIALFLKRQAPEQVTIVRYEDMRANPAASLRHAGEFFGLDLPDAAIAVAIEKSGLERMQREERARTRPKTEVMQGELFRRGVVGGGELELRPSTLREIREQAAPWYERISKLAWKPS